MNHKDYLTPEQVAEIAELTVGGVRKHLQNGNLAGEKEGYAWKVSRQALKEFLAKRESGELPTGQGGWRGGSPHERGRKPDPDSLASQGKSTHLYLPCTPEHRSWLSHVLTGSERLAILNKVARLKEAGLPVEHVLEKLDSEESA